MPKCALPQDWKFEAAPRFGPLYRHEVEQFDVFFRYHSRPTRPHPQRACPVAFSRAWAAGLSAEVSQTCHDVIRYECPLCHTVSKHYYVLV